MDTEGHTPNGGCRCTATSTSALSPKQLRRVSPPTVRTVLTPSPCLPPILNSCLLSPAPPQPTSFRLRLYHLIPSCLRFHIYIPTRYSPASLLSTSATLLLDHAAHALSFPVNSYPIPTASRSTQSSTPIPHPPGVAPGSLGMLTSQTPRSSANILPRGW